MKYRLLVAQLFILAATSLEGQTLERQVIGSSGTYQVASWGSLSSTTGESQTKSVTTTSFILTQGFQQPSQTDLIVCDVPPGNVTVKVFPVPVTDAINVVINMSDARKHYDVTLFDMSGRQMKLPCLDLSSGVETKLLFNLCSLANGNYLVLISDEHNTQVKTINFTKIN